MFLNNDNQTSCRRRVHRPVIARVLIQSFLPSYKRYHRFQTSLLILFPQIFRPASSLTSGPAVSQQTLCLTPPGLSMARVFRPRPTTITGRDMRHLISEISSIRVREDPSACILSLNPLLNTEEGRRFLSGQEREKALILIELFDWVAIHSYAS